jgi:nicotinate-nucleotide adenylyltransferase
LLQLLHDKNVLTQRPIPCIIGQDALSLLPTWHEVETLVEKCWFLQAPRYPEAYAITTVKVGDKAQLLHTTSLAMRPIGIASSIVRQRIQEGLSVRYLIPESVRHYIVDNHLYC